MSEKKTTKADRTVTSAADAPQKTDMLFGDFVRLQYLPYVREHKRSWQTDERFLRLHVLPYIEALPLSSVSADTLKTWVETLELTGLSHSSCYRVFWLVKYILNCAVRWNILPSDAPFREATIKTRPSRYPKMLDSTEALRFIRLLEQYAGRPSAQAIHLLLLTGAGKSEILHARWENVDLKNGTLTTETSFTGRNRLIPLNNEAMKLIRSLPRRDNVPWLFSSPSGRPLVSLQYTWNMLRNELGRPDLRLQDLRHTFAGFLMDMGLSKGELRTIMGHYMPRTLALVQNTDSL